MFGYAHESADGQASTLQRCFVYFDFVDYCCYLTLIVNWPLLSTDLLDKHAQCKLRGLSDALVAAAAWLVGQRGVVAQRTAAEAAAAAAAAAIWLGMCTRRPSRLCKLNASQLHATAATFDILCVGTFTL
jgi:hypothetical protein